MADGIEFLFVEKTRGANGNFQEARVRGVGVGVVVSDDPDAAARAGTPRHSRVHQAAGRAGTGAGAEIARDSGPGARGKQSAAHNQRTAHGWNGREPSAS